MSDKKNSITIKKYANRRLYNTATSSYVTLEDLSVMVKNNEDFNVYDAKSSEDITRSVLTQIIMEEENKSGQQNLLPTNFLRQLIGFYGNNLQWMVPKYLENSMDTLSNNQEQIQDYFKNTLGSMFPFGSTFEEMSKQNLSMFENTMRMISPFGANFDSASLTQQIHKAVSMGNMGSQNASTVKASAPTLEKNDVSKSAETKSSAQPACALKSNKTEKANKSCSIASAPAPTKAAAAPAPMVEPKTKLPSESSKKKESNVASITNLNSKKESKKQAKKEKKKKKKENKSSSSNASSKTASSQTNTPMPNVAAAASNNSGADDMQQKIANLQRQLADLAKSRA